VSNAIHCVGNSAEGAFVKKLVKVALIVGAIVLLAKLAATQKAKWQGLTESEMRDKLDSRLPKWIPGEKRAEIADEVVSGMREQGMIGDEDEASVPAETDGGRGEEEPDSDRADASEDSDDIPASV